MGLRNHILVVVIIAFCTVNLFLCFFIIHHGKALELERFHAQIDKSAYFMRVINTLPLYNVDLETLTINMETFFDDENIKSLSIHDSEVNININLERQKFSGGTDIKKSFVLDYKGLKIGRLTVVYSTALIEEKLARFQARMLGVTIFLTLIISMVFAYLINSIIKPVSGLARIVSETASGNFESEIEQTGIGEVGILSRNFASVRDAIKEKNEQLSRAKTMLEVEIQKKNIQRKKDIRRDMMILAVKTFIQQAMTTQSEQEIAELFIPIVQGLLTGPYCFVGKFCDSKNNLTILSLSDEAKNLCPKFDGPAVGALKQHICGRLVQAITNKAPVIFDSADLKSEFSLLPKAHLSMKSIMALPLLEGSDASGVAVFAGKDGGYSSEDQEVAGMMVMVLGEALRCRNRQDKTKRLEKMIIQSEKMVSAGKLTVTMADEISEPLAEIHNAVQMIRNRFEKTVSDNENRANVDKTGLSFDRLNQHMKDQDIDDNLNMIDLAAKKASMIVSNMRSLSGTTSLGYVFDDICRLLDQSLELALKAYGHKQKYNFSAIQIMKDYALDLPKVRCRVSELKQVFFNILSNGAYAMANHVDNPSPTFFLRTYVRENQVCVEIRDNGPGMSENIRRRIFEPFFSTKSGNEEAGLGLSVAYFIITENHKGAIEVDSVPGEGTCFKILLPI